MTERATTLGQLRDSGWQSRSVKAELRANLLARLAEGRGIMPGIIGFEDSVVPDRKATARDLLKGLGARTGGPRWWVRINPLGSDAHKEDLELLALSDIEGIVLRKTESGADIVQLAHRTGNIPIHAIVTETAVTA